MSRKQSVAADELREFASWSTADGGSAEEAFVGYDHAEVDSLLTAVCTLGTGQSSVTLHELPFYAESSGQVADVGETLYGRSFWRSSMGSVMSWTPR